MYLVNAIVIHKTLTLKAPRKTASENVVCFLLSAEYSCRHFKPIFAYLKEQPDLGPHCLQKCLKSQAEDKADDNCCDWC